MRQNRPKITQIDVEKQNHWRKLIIKDYTNVLEDPRKEERLSAKICTYCFYIPKGGASMITSSNCRACNQILTSSTGSPNSLCFACAKKLSLCIVCGCDLDYKNRRNVDKLISDIEWKE